MNPINRELKYCRNAIEHYNRILREDNMIKNGEKAADGRPKLSNKDILRIREKIKLLTDKRDELLRQEKDYAEIS